MNTTPAATKNAATLLNVLTAFTLMAPNTVAVDEMVRDDVLDARDSWEMVFTSVATREVLRDRGVQIREERPADLYADGRELRIW